MQERIFDIIFKEDEITWQSMIYDLVKTEQMDPWDIDIGTLAQQFLDSLKKLKAMDFRISGKVVLAAAILLRLKSTKLVKEDLGELDRIIAMSEQTQEEFYDELEQGLYDEPHGTTEKPNYTLIPHTPQPRKRKVSVYDLVEALQKALEVKRRRSFTLHDVEITIPEHTIDISEVIEKIYNEVRDYFLTRATEKGAKLAFSKLIKSDNREEKIYTFVPLLHLSNQGRVLLEQEKHLAEIYVQLQNQQPQLNEQESQTTDKKQIKHEGSTPVAS